MKAACDSAAVIPACHQQQFMCCQHRGRLLIQMCTHSCRFVRLGTASLLSANGGPFINLDKLDLRKYATRPCLARVLCDYMLYHDHNPKRALELCAHACDNTEVMTLRSVALPYTMLLVQSNTVANWLKSS